MEFSMEFLMEFSMEFSMESCEYLEGFVKKDFVKDWKQKTYLVLI